ncbi:hypothetical protein CK203_030532 [Vitis vinifera]|uniref:Uncharacterized protein n=1 Tax=Vitis vinifera TaxID=29760 RepID=A0A438JDI6_VITVI|nr:hypothetical protein CK203_030532 [Vitis vinifera]
MDPRPFPFRHGMTQGALLALHRVVSEAESLLSQLEYVRMTSFLMPIFASISGQRPANSTFEDVDAHSTPIEGTQIAERDLSTRSYILIRRPSDNSLSFETLMAYYRVHDYSWRPESYPIHFTIDGRHGILEARHIAEALQILFEPVDPSILEHMGFPTKPQLERRRFFRAIHSQKWNQLAGYSAPLGAPPMVAPPVPHGRVGRASTETIPLVPILRLLLLLPYDSYCSTTSRPTTSEPPSPSLLRSFVALYIPFKHSRPHMFLSSSRWLRCLPIRTSRLLYSARFSSTWDFASTTA